MKPILFKYTKNALRETYIYLPEKNMLYMVGHGDILTDEQNLLLEDTAYFYIEKENTVVFDPIHAKDGLARDKPYKFLRCLKFYLKEIGIMPKIKKVENKKYRFIFTQDEFAYFILKHHNNVSTVNQ